MSFGQTLRNAREAKGFSPSQVAAQTRILVQIITDMENEDFHRIPAPIYGRGFVRLFAECVGLDPAPLTQEFMEIYEGRRAPLADVPAPLPASRAPSSSPHPEPTLPDESAAEPTLEVPPVVSQTAFAPDAETMTDSLSEPIPSSTSWAQPTIPPQAAETQPRSGADISELELFSQANGAVNGTALSEIPTLTRPPSHRQPQPPPLRQSMPSYSGNGEGSPFLPPSYENDGPSAAERFRNSLTNVSSNIIDHVASIPRSTWRISLLGVGALAIVLLMLFACIKLYQATARMPTPDPVAQVPAPSAPPAPSKPATKTKSAPGASSVVKTAETKTTGLGSTGHKIPSLYVD